MIEWDERWEMTMITFKINRNAAKAVIKLYLVKRSLVAPQSHISWL